VPLRVVPGHLYPLLEGLWVLVSVADAAAVGVPRHHLALVPQQQVAVVVAVRHPLVRTQPRVAAPPRRPALGAAGLTVFIIVPAWLLARPPYPLPQRANVLVSVADAAAVGQPGHVLPLVPTQQ